MRPKRSKTRTEMLYFDPEDHFEGAELAFFRRGVEYALEVTGTAHPPDRNADNPYDYEGYREVDEWKLVVCVSGASDFVETSECPSLKVERALEDLAIDFFSEVEID